MPIEPVTITFQDAANATQTVGFDAVISQGHTMSQTITDSPIEQGADVSDHATPDLDVVTVEFFVSQQPITADADPSGRVEEMPAKFPVYEPPLLPTPGSITNAVGGAIKKGINAIMSGGEEPVFQVLVFDEINRPREYYEGFQFLRDNSVLCRVLTSLRDYENMEVLDVQATRDESTGDGASFAVTFREMNLVSTQSGVVKVNASELRGFKAQNKGSKATKGVDGSAGSGNRSVAAFLVDSAVG